MIRAYSGLLIAALVFPACGEPDAATGGDKRLDSSWDVYHDSFDDLRTANLGVVGIVSSVMARTEQSEEGTDSIEVNEITIQVERTVWSHGDRQAPSMLSFTEIRSVEGLAMHRGAKAVVFLDEYEAGKFAVSGGPSGQFFVDGSELKPVARDGLQPESGTTLDAFLAALRQ